MVPEDGGRGRVDEWSIVRLEERREEITMRLSSSQAFEQAALVMPVPARAEFELGDDAEFDEIERLTQPRVEQKKRYTLFDGGGLGGGSSDEGAAGGGAVDVVDEQDLGPLRIVTLRGDDAAAVTQFLEREGFPVPEGLEPIAQEYLDEGWLIVAARLRAEDGEPLQELQPLVMRFASDEVVYPLRMSELASGFTEARVDVISHAPVKLAEDGSWPSRDNEDASQTRTGRIYGGPLPDEDNYLSSFRFAIAGGDLEDPRFVAAERDDLRQVRYEYDNVAIGGWILLGIFGLFVLGLGVIAVVIARARVRKNRAA